MADTVHEKIIIEVLKQLKGIERKLQELLREGRDTANG